MATSAADIIDRELHRERVLGEIFEAADGTPGVARVDSAALAKRLALNENDVLRAMLMLGDSGLITFSRAYGGGLVSVVITPLGVRYVEKAVLRATSEDAREVVRQIESRGLEALARELRLNQQQIDLVMTQIEEIKAQLESGIPRHDTLRRSMRSIQAILENMAGGIGAGLALGLMHSGTLN